MGGICTSPTAQLPLGGVPIPYCAQRRWEDLQHKGQVMFPAAVAVIRFSRLNVLTEGAQASLGFHVLTAVLQDVIRVVQSYGGDVICLSGEILTVLWDQAVVDFDDSSCAALQVAVCCMLDARLWSKENHRIAIAVSFGDVVLSVCQPDSTGRPLLTVTGHPLSIRADKPSVECKEPGILMPADTWATLSSSCYCQGRQVPKRNAWTLTVMEYTLDFPLSVFQVAAPLPLPLLQSWFEEPQCSSNAVVVVVLMPRSIFDVQGWRAACLDDILEQLVQDDGQLVQVQQTGKGFVVINIVYWQPRSKSFISVVAQRCVDLYRQATTPQIKFAITYGPALVRPISSAGRNIHLLLGLAVQQAHYLLTRPDFNQHLIWCNRAVAKACQNIFQLAVQQRESKSGKNHRMAAFALNYADHANQDMMRFELMSLRNQLRTHRIQIVTKACCLALDEAVRAILAGSSPTPVLVCNGAVGMGKTTLAQYLRCHWSVFPMCVVECQEADKMQPFATVRHWFRHIFGVLRLSCEYEDYRANQSPQNLVASILGPDAPFHSLALLQDVLKLNTATKGKQEAGSSMDSSLEERSPEQHQQYQTDVTAALLYLLVKVQERLQVAIFCFDDAHWVDQESWNTLVQFMQWVHDNRRRVVVVLCRSLLDESENGRADIEDISSGVINISLQNFSHKEVEQFLALSFQAVLMPGDKVQNELTTMVAELTWGHPLLLAELCQIMLQKRHQASVNQEGQLTISPASFEILPSVDFSCFKSVHSLVWRLFMSCPEVTQSVLQFAAVAVANDLDHFFLPMVCCMVPDSRHGQMKEAVERLLHAGVLEVVPGHQRSLVATWDSPAYRFALKALPAVLQREMSVTRIEKVNLRLSRLLHSVVLEIVPTAENYHLMTDFAMLARNLELAKQALKLEARMYHNNRDMVQYTNTRATLDELGEESFSDIVVQQPIIPPGSTSFEWTPRHHRPKTPSSKPLPSQPLNTRTGHLLRAAIKTGFLELDYIYDKLLFLFRQLLSRPQLCTVRCMHFELERLLSLLKMFFSLPALYSVRSRPILEQLMTSLCQSCASLNSDTIAAAIELTYTLIRASDTAISKEKILSALGSDIGRLDKFNRSLLADFSQTHFSEISVGQHELYLMLRKLSPVISQEKPRLSSCGSDLCTTYAIQMISECVLLTFAKEEALMHLVAYPQATEHAAIHQKYIDKLLDIQQQYMAGMATVDVEIVGFLFQLVFIHMPLSDDTFAAWFEGTVGPLAEVQRQWILDFCVAQGKVNNPTEATESTHRSSLGGARDKPRTDEAAHPEAPSTDDPTTTSSATSNGLPLPQSVHGLQGGPGNAVQGTVPVGNAMSGVYSPGTPLSEHTPSPADAALPRPPAAGPSPLGSIWAWC